MEMEFQAHISNEEVNALPPGAFGGEIVVVDTLEAQVRACAELSNSAVIGFDTETRPSFSRGVSNQISLLQLSCQGQAFLFRIHKVGMGEELCTLLSSAEVLKVGAAIRDDIRGLQRLKRFTPRGFIDLQQIVHNYGIEELSLRKMGAIALGIRISKAQRLSNWEAITMTPAQQLYAATDAWLGRELYLRLSASSKGEPPLYVEPKEKPKSAKRPKPKHKRSTAVAENKEGTEGKEGAGGKSADTPTEKRSTARRRPYHKWRNSTKKANTKAPAVESTAPNTPTQSPQKKNEP